MANPFELAACYRLMDQFGMTDLIWSNHVTARIPGTDRLLINLYGFALQRTAPHPACVKIDASGQLISQPDTDYGIRQSRAM
jgi:ribulose-5-phosphate 4-epimerase/fuculose-1-phosphate aldolase